MNKLKILCIVGGSGCGKTLAALHLKDNRKANVICSYTTRPPRASEVEGRDHYFTDTIPDRSNLIAYAHFGGAHYFATKDQVFGPCTVYVIDERGLEDLRQNFGHVYDIHSVLIKRNETLRRQSGVDEARIERDRNRILRDDDFDYILINNGTEAELFTAIERIYDTIAMK